MKRREILLSIGAAVAGLPVLLRGRATAAGKKKQKVLYFSRSVLFEHEVARRKDGRPAASERILTELGKKAGFEVVCTKDGRVFDGDLDQYDVIASYSCGTSDDMIRLPSKDGAPPMTRRGRKRLLDAIAAGKGFVAIHPGILLLPQVVGGGCLGHGTQQAGSMVVTSRRFPGLEGLGKSFSFEEEWFSLADFAHDLHVILVQETSGMKTDHPKDKQFYDRPPYPATWARMHGKGRVFYTSMGHREDVWTNKIFQQILLGGFAWALGNVDADLTPNINKVAPKANQRRW